MFSATFWRCFTQPSPNKTQKKHQHRPQIPCSIPMLIFSKANSHNFIFHARNPRVLLWKHFATWQHTQNTQTPMIAIPMGKNPVKPRPFQGPQTNQCSCTDASTSASTPTDTRMAWGRIRIRRVFKAKILGKMWLISVGTSKVQPNCWDMSSRIHHVDQQLLDFSSRLFCTQEEMELSSLC